MSNLVDIEATEPKIFGDNNIIFPSYWTEQQCTNWLDENTTPETRPGAWPPRSRMRTDDAHSAIG